MQKIQPVVKRPPPIRTTPSFMKATKNSDARAAAVAGKALSPSSGERKTPKSAGKKITPRTPQSRGRSQTVSQEDRKAKAAAYRALRSPASGKSSFSGRKSATPKENRTSSTSPRILSSGHKHEKGIPCTRCQRSAVRLTCAQKARAQKIAQTYAASRVKKTVSSSHTKPSSKKGKRLPSTSPRKKAPTATRMRSASTIKKPPLKKVEGTPSARLRDYLRQDPTPPGVSKKRPQNRILPPPGKKKPLTQKELPPDPSPSSKHSAETLPTQQSYKTTLPSTNQPEHPTVEPAPSSAAEPPPEPPVSANHLPQPEHPTVEPAPSSAAEPPPKPTPASTAASPRENPLLKKNPLESLTQYAFSPEVLKAMREDVRAVCRKRSPTPPSSETPTPPKTPTHNELEGPSIDPSYPTPLFEHNLENLHAIDHLLRCTGYPDPNELIPTEINTTLLQKHHLTTSRIVFNHLGTINYSEIHGSDSQIQTCSLEKKILEQYTKLTLPCCLITDEQLIALVSILPNLNEVTLFDCPNITGDGIVQAFQNRSLTKLHLSCCKSVDADSLATLIEQNPALKSLQIIDKTLSSSFVHAIGEHEKLQKIDLAYCSFSDISLVPLYIEAEKPRDLINLDLTGAEIDDDKVQEFKISNSRISVIEKPAKDSSPILHATSRITPIPQLTGERAEELYLKAIQDESEKIYQELLEREADHSKNWGDNPEEFFKNRLRTCQVNPEKTELFSIKSLDFHRLEAYAQAAESLFNLILRIHQQYPFIKQPVRNFFAILETRELKKKITHLYLAGINLTRVPYLLYSDHFPNLTKVELQDNLIQKIPAQFFSGSPKLQILDLSHNRIAFLENIAEFCTNLEKLLLNSNQIKKFPVQLIRAFCSQSKNLLIDEFVENWTPSLTIYLSDNPIEKDPPKSIHSLPIYLGKDLTRSLLESTPLKSPRWRFWKRNQQQAPSRVAVLMTQPEFLEKSLLLKP